MPIEGSSTLPPPEGGEILSSDCVLMMGGAEAMEGDTRGDTAADELFVADSGPFTGCAGGEVGKAFSGGGASPCIIVSVAGADKLLISLSIDSFLST